MVGVLKEHRILCQALATNLPLSYVTVPLPAPLVVAPLGPQLPANPLPTEPAVAPLLPRSTSPATGTSTSASFIPGPLPVPPGGLTTGVPLSGPLPSSSAVPTRPARPQPRRRSS